MAASMKLKSITQIRNAIMDKINESQEIKRYIKYLTPTPLEQYGTDLNGQILNQPDVDINFIREEKKIYPFFSKGLLNESQVNIFVQRRGADLSDIAIGKNSINITIVVPVMYAMLNDEEDRQVAIANIICGLIDGENIGGIGKAQVERADEDFVINDSKEYCALNLNVGIKTLNTKVK